jgi:hypothetical protein
MQDLPYYPRLDEDQQLIREEERAHRAREALDPADVLSEVQAMMLAISDDVQHPLWPLVSHCTSVGTTQETGQRPPLGDTVGAALEPLITKAISRLVTARLLSEEA